MWNRTQPQRYLIREVDLRKSLPVIDVPPGYSGIAVVLRLDGRPAGFLLEAARSGTQFTPEALAERILEEAGKQILSGKIYQQIRGSLPHPPNASVEIAICTHNRADQLARCLESLHRLGIPDASSGAGVLVIDNAPHDDRALRAVNHFPGVRYCMEPKPGLDFARNRAVQESSAELLAFLDDDVVVDAYWFQALRDAWAANPDAAAVTGPILPLELETTAQIAFEKMGGFGRGFERIRFGAVSADSPTYPCGAGMFGAGANMAFRRAVLQELGGFDDALDTGAPLPGGGDLDIFYRIVRAGYVLVREPSFVVYHQHRRDYRALRHQMWTWGLGSMAFLAKSWRTDPSARPKLKRWVLWWISYQFSKILVPFLRKNRKSWPWDLVMAEIGGALAGLCGAYDRSLARTKRLRRQYS
jgi:GT2 family glycosyltransferase